jgi:5'-nucleotidase
MAAGGEGFVALAQGTNRVAGPLDLDLMEQHVKSISPLAPPPLGRITIVAP